MKRKLLGIFVCMLLIATPVLPVAGIMNEKSISEEQEDFILRQDYSNDESVPLGKGSAKVKVFIQGAAVKGANGLKIGPDRNVYIASALGREIVVMNHRNGKVLERLGPDQGVMGPDDLAFGPDGSVYWTDIVTGEVGRLKPNGELTKQFVAPMVNPIAFNDEGRLFVAQAFVNDGLYELDPDLISPPIKILGEGNIALQLNGFEFGPDGLLYAPRPYSSQIVSIDVDTAEVNVIASGVVGPRACALDSTGELYVGVQNYVLHCDIETGVCTTVVEVDDYLDNIAFDKNDRLYISNGATGEIYRQKWNGRLKTVSPGGLIVPQGITVHNFDDDDSDETIFIADWWSMKGFDGHSGKYESYEHLFNFSPMTVSSDGEYLVLSSWYSNLVVVMCPETKEFLEMHSFNVPSNAIRFNGDLVANEIGTGSVVLQDGITSERTTLASGFYLPTGIAYTCDDDDDDNGNLWVTDWITGIVYQIIEDGYVLDTPKIVTTGLVYPEGMAVWSDDDDDDIKLLVVESGAGRLTGVDPETGEKTTIADNLALGAQGPPGWMPYWLFNDVAVGENGNIYVTGDVGNVVYRIRLKSDYPDFPFMNWLFEHFPNALPILRSILG